MVKVLSLKRPLTEVSSYFRLLRFSLSSMTGFLPCLVRMGPPCKMKWNQSCQSNYIKPQSYSRRIHLWMLTSLPSSDPVGVISSDLVTAGAAMDWLLFSSSDLVSDGKGTPNASRTCVSWIWHRQQLKLISHLLKTTTPENVPCVTATCGI